MDSSQADSVVSRKPELQGLHRNRSGENERADGASSTAMGKKVGDDGIGSDEDEGEEEEGKGGVDGEGHFPFSQHGTASKIHLLACQAVGILMSLLTTHCFLRGTMNLFTLWCQGLWCLETRG